MTRVLIVLFLAAITFIPGLELRASIPVGFFHNDVRTALPLPLLVAVCIASNIVVGMTAFWLMRPVEKILRRWAWFERLVWPIIMRTQDRLHPYVQKYGEWGLAFFIGVPLPGTGAYAGAVGAYLLGFDKRRFWLANFAGVLLAGLAVTALCLLLDAGVVSSDSWLQKLFLSKHCGAPTP